MMLFFLTIYHDFGLIGSALVVFTTFYAALRYTGRRGERFSFLNHYISELGEIGVSPNAPVFNFGLIAGGILFIPFIIGVGISLASVWGYLSVIAGLCTTISCTLVGVYPIHKLTAHVKAAMSYFRSGLVTVLLTSVAILTQPVGHIILPYSILLISFFTILAYAAFLLMLRAPRESVRSTYMLDPNLLPERPRFWIVPALEWIIFITSILWYFSIAILIQI